MVLGVLHGEDFGKLFFVLLPPRRTGARQESSPASRLTCHGHSGHRLTGTRVGARHGRRWCAGQDCGELGAAAETEDGWVASFSAAPSRESMIHAAGGRRRWRRQSQGHSLPRTLRPRSVKSIRQQLQREPVRPAGTTPTTLRPPVSCGLQIRETPTSLGRV